MITIINHGKETFRATCPICGCEFTYQAEDLKEDCFHNHHVECPECKTLISHAFEEKKRCIDPDTLWDYAKKHTPDYEEYPAVFLTPNTYLPDCDKCPNRPDPNKPVQVGDTPCTWCKKMQPYCSNGIADYATGPITVSPNLNNCTYTTGDPHLPKDLPTGTTLKTTK